MARHDRKLGDPQQMEARLDALDERIRQQRRDLDEEHGPHATDEHAFYESGTIHDELTDDQITPPG